MVLAPVDDVLLAGLAPGLDTQHGQIGGSAGVRRQAMGRDRQRVRPAQHLRVGQHGVHEHQRRLVGETQSADGQVVPQRGSRMVRGRSAGRGNHRRPIAQCRFKPSA